MAKISVSQIQQVLHVAPVSDEPEVGHRHWREWREYGDWLRTMAGNLGHSSAYISKRLSRRTIRTVVMVMSMRYWPKDCISAEQEDVLLSEVTKYSHLINPDIPFANHQFQNVKEYIQWDMAVQAAVTKIVS